MILTQEAMRDTLPPETATFQTVLTRYGYILLASQPIVSIPERATAPGAPPNITGH
jgi:hypothetical protein